MRSAKTREKPACIDLSAAKGLGAMEGFKVEGLGLEFRVKEEAFRFRD